MDSNSAEVRRGEPGDGECIANHAPADSDDDDMLFRERRRAKSLPAYPEQARALEALSQRRRCSKSVRFADSLGLSLASVRHYSAAEEPRVPSAALPRLRSFPPARHGARLVPAFPMPVECCDFEGRASQRHVSLEKVAAGLFGVTGLIRVPAWCPATHVGVRYTFNEWLSFVDAQAVSAPPRDARDYGEEEEEEEERDAGSACQRFAFTMLVPPLVDAGSAVHFAVFCRSEHGEFWDNNGGRNYTLRYERGPWHESADLE